MKYKGLLLDIDNTIYSYKEVHEDSISRVIRFCENELNVDKEKALQAFSKARKRVHIELSETASSHNRLLYFQKMLELLGENSLKYGLDLYNTYWDNFISKMTAFEGIYEVLEKYKGNICLVTDLTAHIQHRKVQKLALDKYCNYMVTSEEAGKEKPHPYMFMMALHKMGLEPQDVCMIGDSFNKDIFGASNLGIQSIWVNLTKKNESYDESLVQEIHQITELKNLL